jgi:peptide/nickel transport system substrate-binding protein
MDNPAFATQWDKLFPLKKYNYDPGLANRMLDQAGWVRGPDGVRAKDGVRLSFDYETTQPSPGGPREQIQALVKADLYAVGIEAKPRMLSREDFFGTAASVGGSGILPLRQFDFAETGQGWQPDATLFLATKYIPSAENNYGYVNVSGYSNKHFDDLYDQDQFEIDRTKRAPLIAEMQSLVAEDLPVMPLFVRSTPAVYTPKLVNWDESGWTVTPLFKAGTIYFK